MLIDWFTVLAQLVNFLVLVWLLKRFLYKPVLAAIDAREKSIVDQLDNARKKEAEAQNEREEFQRKNEEFEQQRTVLLNKVAIDANLERQRLFDEARQAADVMSAKRQESLRNEARTLNQTITRRTQHEVFAIARKALAELASANLEECMVETFIRRLREMDDKSKEIVTGAIKTASGPALLRSTFDLAEAQRAAIVNTLNVTFSTEINVRFETSPELVSGIEFSMNGQKVAWSIADYLSSLEKSVAELLKEKLESKADSKPVTKSP